MRPFLALCHTEFPACPLVCFDISAISSAENAGKFERNASISFGWKAFEYWVKESFLLSSKLLLEKIQIYVNISKE